MVTELNLPDDPCGRMVEIADAIAARKRWFQGWNSLRFAGLGLIVSSGSADQIADDLFGCAEGLKSALPWWSSLRNDLRFCVASFLVTHGRGANEFLEAFEPSRRRFRDLRLPKSEVHEALACLVLMDRVPGAVPTQEQVERLNAMYRGMKEHHPYLTGRDDYAAAALLASTEDSVERVLERVERLYQALRDLRFHRGNQLQLAAHLLYFADGTDEDLAARFRQLYDAFKAEGLWMYDGDFDEIAVLASVNVPTHDVVERVLTDRRRLREELTPKPSAQQGFELASATALLTLAQLSDAPSEAFTGHQLARIVALVQAQQAAIVAATAGGAAAASG
ncbi:MAG: DUF4003 family protein [Planctomycetota bacterium]